MADNKKMSVQDILAAARKEKGGGADAPKPAEKTEAAKAEATEKPAAEPSVEPAAKPAAAKKPGAMSVADMLAAARAEKSGAKPAAAPAPKAEKPAAPKPAPKPKAEAPAEKPTPAKAAGPKDTASILAQARGGAKPGPMTKAEAAEKAKAEDKTGKKLAVPPMPEKPAYLRPTPAGPAGETSRRGFISSMFGVFLGSSLAVGFTSLAVTHLLWALGLARFMFPNILTEPPTKFKVGFPDEFAPGQVETKFVPQFGVWIVRFEYEGQPQIYALQTVCTHLGCTPNWLEGEQKFKCPCHGSGFYKSGINFEGPAPRPLERFAIRLADDGQLEVDKSRKFLEEKGEWKDSASFVPV